MFAFGSFFHRGFTVFLFLVRVCRGESVPCLCERKNARAVYSCLSILLEKVFATQREM